MTEHAATPTAPTPSAVQQFDQLVEGIGGYGGQCATPPHVLAPTVAFSDQLKAMRRRVVGLETAVGFLAGGPFESADVLSELDDLVNAIVAMGGHRKGIAHLLRQALAADRTDAERYRALRTGAILGLNEDQGLVLGVTIVVPDEYAPIERPMTESLAPFLTDAERSDLNGDGPNSKGYVRGSDAIDRAVDFVRKAIRTPDAAAPRETRTEGSFEEREVSDEPRRTLTDGSPVTPDHRDIDPLTGQQKAYVVLSAEERAKGFVRPVRDRYLHLPCGTVTTMGRALAETYARQPDFYSGTFCCGCGKHYPVGADGEFVWDGTDVKVGT